MNRSCQALALVSLALCMGLPLQAQARKLCLEAAVDSSEIVIVGRLVSVRRGTFGAPSQRSGELKVAEVFKGTPPAERFRIKLPDQWGRPSLPARLGMPSFWGFIASVALAIFVTLAATRKRRSWKHLCWLLLLVPLGLVALVPQVSEARIEDWKPPRPS